MVRPNVYDGALFIAVQRFVTRRLLMFELWFDATAAVQLVNALQYAELAPASADSNQGCTGTLAAATPPGHGYWSPPPPQSAEKTLAKAWENCWPPSVNMYGTASTFSSEVSLWEIRPM